MTQAEFLDKWQYRLNLSIMSLLLYRADLTKLLRDERARVVEALALPRSM